jgi:hypothetical protein
MRVLTINKLINKAIQPIEKRGGVLCNKRVFLVGRMLDAVMKI